MAKRISLEPQVLIPESERASDHPLTIYYRPMSKRMKDRFDSQLYIAQFGDKLPTDGTIPETDGVSWNADLISARFETMLDCALVACPDDGAYVANVEDDAGHYERILDKTSAISFIMDELDPEVADEIQNQLQDALGLTEVERKNS